MRFRHLDPSPVLAWLEREPCEILKLEWDRERPVAGLAAIFGQRKTQSAGPAQRAGANEVAYFASLGDGPAHSINLLRFYFHVNGTTPGGLELPLVDAVGFVERNGQPNECLLAGHPDGGLISVSRQRLPFQQGDPITWWGP